MSHHLMLKQYFSFRTSNTSDSTSDSALKCTAMIAVRILVPCGGIRPPALAPACVVHAADERASFVFVWIPQTAAARFVKTAYPVWVCLALCVCCLPAPRTQLETEAGPQRICLTLDSGEALTDQGCLFLGTSALPHVLSRHLGFPHMLLSLDTDFETSGNCSNCVSWVPDDRLGKIQNREIYLESYTCLKVSSSPFHQSQQHKGVRTGVFADNI